MASHTFTPQQNPAPGALGDVELPPGYEGVGVGEHLVGLYSDLVAKGASLASLPLHQPLPKAYFPAEGEFFAHAKRAERILVGSGLDEASFVNSVYGSWWDFVECLPMQTNPEAGLYLLRVILHFGETFDALVASLARIFAIENVSDTGVFPKLDALDRFQHMMSESSLDDGAVLSVAEAWRAAKVWEYSEVRKLLASAEDQDYFLRLAAIGCTTFEEALEVSKTMRKDWVYSLTSDF